MRWRQGEHVLLIGQTGSGKTALAKELLTLRRYCLALVAKADDLHWHSWRTIRTAEEVVVPRGQDYAYLRLLPDYEQMETQFQQALRKVWQQGGWCVYLDELYYLEDLGCKNLIRQLLTQGRSKRISVVCGCQRPAHVTRYAMSETTHILSGKIGDRRDVDTLRKFVGEGFTEHLQELTRYTFIYYNKYTEHVIQLNRDTVTDILGGQ
jgi:energy-coupling factor transporter ATP-binding protein EcfA2